MKTTFEVEYQTGHLLARTPTGGLVYDQAAVTNYLLLAILERLTPPDLWPGREAEARRLGIDP